MFIPLVTQEEFGRITCMDAKAFGVHTSCDTCEYDINGCLRRNLVSALINNQVQTENLLGYDLSKQYHEEEFDWDGSTRFQLDRRGIVALNVKESVTTVVSAAAISPYIIEGQAVAAGIVTIADSIASNPGFLIFRDPSTGSAIEQLQENNYPRRSGSNWLIKIDTDLLLVNVQHCKYMKVTIATPVCVGGEIFAVYPGTNDLIPFAKDPVVSGLNTTYWFYAWSMVDKDFKEDDEIDLFSGQFYKLITTIDFVCRKDIEALPVVTFDQGCCCEDGMEVSETEDLTITYLGDGIIDIHQKCAWTTACKGDPLRLKVFYRTAPTLRAEDLANLAEAIVYLTAAELPTISCNCETPKNSFISEAQKYYGDVKINPFTGSETWQVRYGDRHGQVVYAQRLAKVSPMRKARII